MKSSWELRLCSRTTGHFPRSFRVIANPNMLWKIKYKPYKPHYLSKMKFLKKL